MAYLNSAQAQLASMWQSPAGMILQSAGGEELSALLPSVLDGATRRLPVSVLGVKLTWGESALLSAILTVIGVGATGGKRYSGDRLRKSIPIQARLNGMVTTEYCVSI